MIRKTTNGQTYLTAKLYISVISSGATSISSITIIVTAIIPILTLDCLIVAIILITICVWKRRTLSSFPNQKLKTDNDTLTKQRSSSKDCINQPSYAQEHDDHAYYELKNIVETDITDANSSPKTQLEERHRLEMAYEEITEVIDPRMVPIPLDVFKIHIRHKSGKTKEHFLKNMDLWEENQQYSISTHNMAVIIFIVQNLVGPYASF